MEKEIWKEYPNCSDYLVSNLGNVKTKARLSKTGIKLKSIKLSQYLGTTGRLSVSINRKPRKIHQLVAETFLNHTPCGYKIVVDHINHIPTDNRLENLRLITQRENANKKHLKSTSKYTGVYWDSYRNKWRAGIVIDGKRKNLGRFKDELKASEAYQEALLKLDLR